MSTSEGPRCDVSIEGGSQTGYHGRGAQGDTHGGRRIQILCQPFQLVAIKLFARITIQISDSVFTNISMFYSVQCRVVGECDGSPGDHCHPDWSPRRPHHLQSTQF